MAPIRYSTVLLVLAGTLALSALGGCDFITGDPTPEEARLVLEGDADAQVELLVSKVFLTARNEVGDLRLQIIGSDTLAISPPFNQTFDIREEQQFFARATAADTTVATNVRMQVFVDGDPKYDETRDISEEFLQFLFLFNRRVLRTDDVEVL